MNFVNIYIFLTLLLAIVFYQNKREFKFIILILALGLCNEIYSYFLIAANLSTILNVSIYTLIHNLLWLLLMRSVANKLLITILCGIYLLFGITNLLFFEGMASFNHNSFIAGALLYVVIFILRSFNELKKENLHFFTSNKYILLFAPVLFFIGLSFVFGFKSALLAQTTIVGELTLYQAIITVVNFVYYSMINLYIYKEKRDRCLTM